MEPRSNRIGLDFSVQWDAHSGDIGRSGITIKCKVRTALMLQTPTVLRRTTTFQPKSGTPVRSGHNSRAKGELDFVRRSPRTPCKWEYSTNALACCQTLNSNTYEIHLFRFSAPRFRSSRGSSVDMYGVASVGHRTLRLGVRDWDPGCGISCREASASTEAVGACHD